MARLTKFPNGLSSYLVDNLAVEKKANYTVITTTDSGKTFTSELDGVVFTLPAIAIGNVITIVNTAREGKAALNISPNSSDGITYAGSSTDNKALINAKSTAKEGDFVTLASLNGTVAWQVVAVRGAWTKES
jgi:hypothetical protein